MKEGKMDRVCSTHEIRKLPPKFDPHTLKITKKWHDPGAEGGGYEVGDSIHLAQDRDK
jgi:hypothetical protein